MGNVVSMIGGAGAAVVGLGVGLVKAAGIAAVTVASVGSAIAAAPALAVAGVAAAGGLAGYAIYKAFQGKPKPDISPPTTVTVNYNVTINVVVHSDPKLEQERSKLLEENRALNRQVKKQQQEFQRQKATIEADQQKMKSAMEKIEKESENKLSQMEKKHQEELSKVNTQNQSLVEQLKKMHQTQMDTITKELQQHRQRLELSSETIKLNTRMAQLNNQERQFLSEVSSGLRAIDEAAEKLIKDHEKKKQELVSQGFQFLESEKVKQILQTSPAVKKSFREAVEKLDAIRAEAGSGLDDYVKELRQKHKAIIDEMSNQETKLVEVIEDFKESLIQFEGYVSKSSTPAGTLLTVNCPCGRAHSGPWYHPSGNRINTYANNPNYEVIADGKGRWMCKQCKGPHKIEDFVFSCENHKDTYREWKPKL